ncbi:MAG: DUF1761 domain-containing protein [Hyphomicrobiaceae bacterium]|nr:DUF1761 domain-containing protein [Hyphomicrobiaceae bacterium]
MVLGEINIFAAVAGATASFVFGGIWYSALSKHWMEAAGRSPEGFKESVGLYLLTFAAQLVMAVVLAAVLVHLERGGIPIRLRSGLLSAALVWFGFVVTTMSVNYAFHGARAKLTLIDGAHWLGVLLIQGAVLALWTGA